MNARVTEKKVDFFEKLVESTKGASRVHLRSCWIPLLLLDDEFDNASNLHRHHPTVKTNVDTIRSTR